MSLGTSVLNQFEKVTAVKGLFFIFQPVHEISNNVVCATSRASDQPMHTCSLIRAFVSRLSIL